MQKINRAVVFDTETANIAGGVIEVAALEVGFVDGKLEYGTSYTERFGLPEGFRMDCAAVAAHHILPEELEGLDVFRQLPHFCAADLVIGHNVSFDLRVSGFTPTASVCTLAMARSFFPKQKHTLTALMYYIHGMTHNTRRRLREAHSALADVHFCYELLAYMLDGHKEVTSFETLFEFYNSLRVPSTMPGDGKHGGQPISKVPPDYRMWYRNKSKNPDPAVLEAFIKYPYLCDIS